MLASIVLLDFARKSSSPSIAKDELCSQVGGEAERQERCRCQGGTEVAVGGGKSADGAHKYICKTSIKNLSTFANDLQNRFCAGNLLRGALGP